MAKNYFGVVLTTKEHDKYLPDVSAASGHSQIPAGIR